MKAFWQTHKKALRRGLLILLALWALWYARPLDVYDLMGGETPDYLMISIYPQSNFPAVLHDDLTLTAGTPKMDAVLERMEDIRFHRNPLEVVLQFLPQGTRTTEVDPEDYRVHFSGASPLTSPTGTGGTFSSGTCPSTSSTARRRAGSWGRSCGR